MKKIKYKKVSITMPEDLHDEYKKWCNEKGSKVSTRITKLVENDML